jgi:hypothetical protein
MSNLADIFEGVAVASEGIGAALAAVAPPVAPIAAIIGIAMRSAAGFARAGKDAVIEIQRIHSAEPGVKHIHDEWEDFIAKRRWKTPDNEVPEAPDPPAVDADDPYEGNGQ